MKPHPGWFDQRHCADCGELIPKSRMRCAVCQRQHRRDRERARRAEVSKPSVPWQPSIDLAAVKARMPRWLREGR